MVAQEDETEAKIKVNGRFLHPKGAEGHIVGYNPNSGGFESLIITTPEKKIYKVDKAGDNLELSAQEQPIADQMGVQYLPIIKASDTDAAIISQMVAVASRPGLQFSNPSAATEVPSGVTGDDVQAIVTAAEGRHFTPNQIANRNISLYDENAKLIEKTSGEELHALDRTLNAAYDQQQPVRGKKPPYKSIFAQGADGAEHL